MALAGQAAKEFRHVLGAGDLHGLDDAPERSSSRPDPGPRRSLPARRAHPRTAASGLRRRRWRECKVAVGSRALDNGRRDRSCASISFREGPRHSVLPLGVIAPDACGYGDVRVADGVAPDVAAQWRRASAPWNELKEDAGGCPSEAPHVGDSRVMHFVAGERRISAPRGPQRPERPSGTVPDTPKMHPARGGARLRRPPQWHHTPGT